MDTEPSISEYLKLYEIYQNYVLRELNLINNRLTWVLTIHGFLYGIYGLTIQKQMEVTNYTSFIEHYNDCVPKPIYLSFLSSIVFLFLVSIVGGIISFLGWRSIAAATRAMVALSCAFDKNVCKVKRIKLRMPSSIRMFKRVKGNYFRSSYCELPGNMRLPILLGGGEIDTNKIGNRASELIPKILIGSWVCSLIVLSSTAYENRTLACKLFKPTLNITKGSTEEENFVWKLLKISF